MGARFIGVDREQVFLMPPSVRDWVPDGHLVWTVLDAVGELELSAFYAAYRADGHGRPAYEPSMMVALLMYAYARGNRSARGIERACVEDVAYRVVPAIWCRITRRSRSSAAVTSTRWARCSRACWGCARGSGWRRSGWCRSTGRRCRRDAVDERQPRFRQIARAILREAAEIDQRGEQLDGDARGDELPEHLRTREGRREALREAKERLARERDAAADAGDDDDEDRVAIELDPRQFVTRPQGRRAWLREGRRALEGQREREGCPIPGDRRAACSRRTGAWSRNSMPTGPPTPPMSIGARTASPPTVHGGWRPACSSLRPRSRLG